MPLSQKHFIILAIATFACFGAARRESNDLPAQEQNLEKIWFESAGGHETTDRHHFVLRGPDARHQLIVTGQNTSGPLCDLARSVKYQVSPEGLLQIDETGLVTPLAEGEATVTAIGPEGLTIEATIAVEHFENPPVVNFPNQVVPIFTKLHCNGNCD